MRYSLSYTAASIRIHDTILVATAMIKGCNNYDSIDQKIGNGKSKTGMRIRSEIFKRLSNLSPNQLEYLQNANLDDAYKMAFLSICKTYDFIHEFVIEVLREKMFQLNYTITDGEYLSFFNRKAESHPELYEISESSNYKLKQVLFKILEEADIIDSTRNKILKPQFLSSRVETLIREDNEQLLRIFFFSDIDIEKSPFLNILKH